jgi:hypothetical protein
MNSTRPNQHRNGATQDSQAARSVRRGGRAPRWSSTVVGVAIGLGFAISVLGSGGSGFFSHTICRTGESVGGGTFWTAYSLTNAPYHGTGYYRAEFGLFELLGFTEVNARGDVSNGNLSTGYFETQRWTLYVQSNDTVNGPGLDRPCASRYSASPSTPAPDISAQGLPLQGPGNTSNAGEPTTFNDSDSIPSVVFSNGFVSTNHAPVTTCGKTATELNFTSDSFDVSITINGTTGSTSAIVSIASVENFTYDFPANGGTWLVDDLQLNPGLRGPGLAFSWQPC